MGATLLGQSDLWYMALSVDGLGLGHKEDSASELTLASTVCLLWGPVLPPLCPHGAPGRSEATRLPPTHHL